MLNTVIQRTMLLCVGKKLSSTCQREYLRISSCECRTVCASDTIPDLKLVDDIKVVEFSFPHNYENSILQFYSLTMNVAIYIVGVISSVILVIMGTYVTYQNVSFKEIIKYFID